jgi:hypothetical protein
MIKTKHKTQPKQPKETKETKQTMQAKETKQTKQTKQTKKPKKIYKGGNNSTVAFTYQIKDINSAINKYEIIFIERQKKLLYLCNNFLNKLKASEGSLNNKYKIFSYSTKYDKSRYVTLINKEFYENIFKNYFIPILQLINIDNIVTEQNDLKKIAEYLNFITDDDVDTNDEKRKKINRDFQIFEKYVTDDNIDEIELKRDVENSLGKLKNLMATTNFDKDKIIDIKDLNEKIDIINNKIDKWKAPSWQDILLSTFDSDIETINKKGLHKYNKIYIDAIGNFLSIEGGQLNNYDEKSISKIKNEIEKALTKIKELKEDESNEKDTSELLNIVLINIKKLLLNLINKNYTKNISSIQKLKQYCKKETAEINKYIDNYKIKLDEFSMQKTSSIPEKPKEEEQKIEQKIENVEKPTEQFDIPTFTEEDVLRIKNNEGAFKFWKNQGINVDPNEIKAELSPDKTYVTTYWNSLLNESYKNNELAELRDGKFYLGNKILSGNDLVEYAKNIRTQQLFKFVSTITYKDKDKGEVTAVAPEIAAQPEPEIAARAPEIAAQSEPEIAAAPVQEIAAAPPAPAQAVPPTRPLPPLPPPSPATGKETQQKNVLGEFGGAKVLQSGTQQRGIEQSPTPNSLSINQSTIGADNTAAQEIKKERKGFLSKVKDTFRNAIDQQVDDGIQYLNEESEKDEEQKRKATRYYFTEVATRTPPRTQQQYIKPSNNPPPAAADPRGPMTDSRWVGGNNKKNTSNVSISKESKYKVCGYVTDVEGNMDYFNKYVKISKILEWTNDKKNRLRFKKEDSIFVYGGDTQDKGPADIRFVNILLKFKEDYPNRVIFIIGNRDANKLRIPSELFETYKNEKIFLKKYDNYPYWIDSDKRLTLRKYLKENNYELNIKNRLKYIIESNMGFEDGFEKRRTELSIILKKNISKITDIDVISSFVNSVMPFPEKIELSNDNYTLKYLMQGQIAYIFGEHIFVHGAINEYNIGQIPKNKNKIDDINIWVNELNSWFHKELNEYINNPTIGGITNKRKAYNIIDYVIPKEKSISVVHANNLKKGNGKHINKNVSKILNKYGIKNIITGHKPHGDCPLVIRDKNITAISADTSYSNVNYLREKNKIDGDNRGNAVSEVLLYSNGCIRIHGKYANNSKYSNILKERTNEKNMELNDYIGMQLNNKYWVKNINNINKKLLISYGKDYELYDKWISLKEVNDLLK